MSKSEDESNGREQVEDEESSPPQLATQDFVVPRDKAKLKACIKCGLIKTEDQVHTPSTSGNRPASVRTAASSTERGRGSPTTTTSTSWLTQYCEHHQPRFQLDKEEAEDQDGDSHCGGSVCDVPQLSDHPPNYYTSIFIKLEQITQQRQRVYGATSTFEPSGSPPQLP